MSEDPISPETVPSKDQAVDSPAQPAEPSTPLASPDGPAPTDSPSQAPPPFVSQAVQDLANGEEGLNGINMPKPALPSIPPTNPVKSLGWLALYVLSLGVTILWGAISFINKTPFNWSALILTLATVLVSVPTFHFIKLPARATLATIGLSLALTLTSLYNPEAILFPGVSFPVLWAAVLVLAWLVVTVAVWRTIGPGKPGLAVIITFALCYPLLGSGLSLFHSLSSFLSGAEGPGLTLATLNHSPVKVTDNLPYFLWPQAIMALLIPFIAALVAFKAQLSMFIKRKTPISLAPFFAGLAFLFLLVPSFLAFTPLSAGTNLAKGVRGFYQDADFWYSSRDVAKATAAKPGPAVSAPTPAPAPQAPDVAPDVALAETAETTDVVIAATVPETPTTDPATLETPPATPAAAAPETPPVANTAPETVPAPLAVVESPGKSASVPLPPVTPIETPQADIPKTETAKIDDSSVAVVVTSDVAQDKEADERATAFARSEFFERLTAENAALEKEKADLEKALAELKNQNSILKNENDLLAELKNQNLVLKNENDLLRERLSISDQLLQNLTKR